MSARGEPVESKIVREPLGEVLEVLATDGGGLKLSAVEMEATPEDAVVEDREEFSDIERDPIESAVELVAELETEPRCSGGAIE
jgi:hypothetical protein